MSDTAKDFVRYCLTIDPASRPTAAEALQHKWLADTTPHFVPDPDSTSGQPTNLLPHIQKQFDARKTFRKAVLGMMAMRRMSAMPAKPSQLALDVEQYRKDAEEEHVDEVLAQPEDLNSPTTPTAASSLAPPTPSSPPAPSQATPARAPSPNPRAPSPNPPASVSPTPPSTSSQPPKAPSPSNSSDGGKRGGRSGSGHWWQRLTRHL